MTVQNLYKRKENRLWLRRNMNPYFFSTMRNEPEALDILQRELGALQHNRRVILADREEALILAVRNRPGSLYESLTLREVMEREISFAMFVHSEEGLPGLDQSLEIQRFEFDRKSNEEINAGMAAVVPRALRARVRRELSLSYPDFDLADFDRLLKIIWLNHERYLRVASPLRIAQVVNLLQKGNRGGGMYLEIEPMDNGVESRVHFAVGNPPQSDFLVQVMEVFNRLQLGVNRAYCLAISNGVHPYFLGTFYVRPHAGGLLERDSAISHLLRHELATTQILSTRSHTYREFVVTGEMSGEDASLVNAFIAFCHSNLAHNQPDRFGLDDVKSAFHSHPEVALQLVRLFRSRFDPEKPDREAGYAALCADTQRMVDDYNTGHRYLDEARRAIFSCCLVFIRHILKCNFFVPDKQALAFRLDPAYLAELGEEFTADLPSATPFRITFFFSRFGFGYHIGFSDIARGGWRTVIARDCDDFITNANTLFRENFVLAHTQHFKNKDIYEGGSKLVMLLDATDLQRAGERELETLRLYRLQYGVVNAFLDIFVTAGGVVKSPSVVDYYREDEPIELGPDENMHDAMIEAIARLSERRGYMLGIGIMSSKRVGINHKEYGVTSTGVVKFAEITMQELAIDIRSDRFSVKITGGPNGDVAGNALRIMLDRSPQVEIRLILDGTAALFDPQGADHDELRRIILKEDLDRFDPGKMHSGAMMLFRSGSRREGLRELYRKVTRGESGLEEEWISLDEFSREYGQLPFIVQADLFVPAGGRPETIDIGNWREFLLPDGTPSARAIVEGANSFITPAARVELQKSGILVMRDASANKCGVISSSYEIIANLLFSETEFLEQKERYVSDVLEILEKRAGDEARLILRRRREQPGLLATDISDSLSREINGYYARLFRYFQDHPDLSLKKPFRNALLAHLPKMVREEPRFRRRLSRLPSKYRSAMLAAEIGSSLVYRGDSEADFADAIRLHLARSFPEKGRP